MEMIRLSAANDVNGNPRRAFVAILEGNIVGAWDEGYYGTDCVPTELRHKAVHAPTFAVMPKEYRDTLREFRCKDKSFDKEV